MHRLMSELRQEHIGFHQLIALLTSKLNKLKQGIQPNFSLLEDAIDYIDNYAGVYHHPKEDIIYTYIIEQQLDEKGIFADIQQQHKKFPGLIRRLKQDIQSILMDTVVPREMFIAQLAEFITAEQKHLEQEDNVIYPLIDSLLTEQDWVAVSKLLPDQIEDPLFGSQVKAEYKELYKRLLETEAQVS